MGSPPLTTGTARPDTLGTVQSDLEQILIDRDRIARRIAEMADQITSDLEDLQQEDDIVLVSVLTGSIIFLADLIRRLPQKLRIDLVTVNSYPGTSTESRGAQIVGAIPGNLE